MNKTVSQSIVCIIGRPNVGKSSLFNALLRKKIAITSEVSGVTRDRLFQRLVLEDGWVWLVDTGGFMPNKSSEDPLANKVLEQIELAIEECSLCLFLADAEVEVTDQDLHLANLILRKKKEVWLLVNKIDKNSDLSPFYQLGLGEPLGVSALHRSNISILTERLNAFAVRDTFTSQRDTTTIAVFGKPNVGKSSLINRILGESRVIVSDVPGTTRDRIQIPFVFEGKEVVLLDTAGLRRKGKTSAGLEFFSYLRTLKAITMTDIGILLLNANEGMTSYEIDLCQELVNSFKGIILAFNKIDLVEDGKRLSFLKDRLSYWLPFFPYLKPHFISALTGRGVEKIVKEALEIEKRRKQHIQTSDLNTFLKDLIKHNAPPTTKHGKRIKIGFLQQAQGDVPHFIFHGRRLNELPDNYKRYIKSQFYKRFSLEGVSIKIEFKDDNVDKIEE